MFTLKAEHHDWPFPGPVEGETVRFFHRVGHFGLRQVERKTGAQEWIVTDDRRVNERGGPDAGVTFATREEAEAFVRADGPRP